MAVWVWRCSLNLPNRRQTVNESSVKGKEEEQQQEQGEKKKDWAVASFRYLSFRNAQPASIIHKLITNWSNNQLDSHWKESNCLNGCRHCQSLTHRNRGRRRRRNNWIEMKLNRSGRRHNQIRSITISKSNRAWSWLHGADTSTAFKSTLDSPSQKEAKVTPAIRKENSAKGIR